MGLRRPPRRAAVEKRTLGLDGVGDEAVHHAHRVGLPVQDLLHRAALRRACRDSRFDAWNKSAVDEGSEEVHGAQGWDHPQQQHRWGAPRAALPPEAAPYWRGSQEQPVLRELQESRGFSVAPSGNSGSMT